MVRRGSPKLIALGLIGLTVIVVAVCTAAIGAFTQHLVANDARAVSNVISDVVTRTLPASSFDNGRWPQQLALHAPSIADLAGRHTRLSFYDRHGNVLWSDDPEQVNDPDVHLAVKGGFHVEIETLVLEPRTSRPLSSPVRVQEIFVPIRYEKGGPVVGVLGIHRDAPELFAAIDHASTVVWAVGGGAALLLYLPLFGFVYARAPKMEALDGEKPLSGLLSLGRAKSDAEHVRDVVYTVDTAGQFTSLSPAFEAMTGWLCSDWIGKPLTLLVHPDDIVRASEKAESSAFTARILSRNGEHIRADFIAQTGKGGVMVIGPREGLARRARPAGAERPGAVEATGGAIVCADVRGRIVHFDRAAERMFRCSADELVGQPMTVLVAEPSRDSLGRRLAMFLAGEARVAGATVEAVGCRKDGSEFPLKLALATWRTDAGSFVMAVLDDTTAGGLAHAVLRRMHDVREDEARRIAHELHDEAAQLLASVHMAVADWAQAPAASAPGQLQRVTGLLDQIEVRLRDLSHELRPTMLDDLGVIPALEFLATHVSKRAGITVTIEGSTRGRLAPAVETALYRIAQEALTNVARHAHATSARVRIERERRVIRCSIIDDGLGFDVPAVLSRKEDHGLGLLGIRERVESLLGTVHIEAAPDRGTELRVTIPLEG